MRVGETATLGPVQLEPGGEPGQPLLVGVDPGLHGARLGLGGGHPVAEDVGPGSDTGHLGVPVGGLRQLVVERVGLLGAGQGDEGRVLGLEVPHPVVERNHDGLDVVDRLACRTLTGGVGGAVGGHGEGGMLAGPADRAAGPHRDLARQLGRHPVETGLADLQPALLESSHLGARGIPVGLGAAEHGRERGPVPGGVTPWPGPARPGRRRRAAGPPPPPPCAGRLAAAPAAGGARPPARRRRPGRPRPGRRGRPPRRTGAGPRRAALRRVAGPPPAGGRLPTRRAPAAGRSHRAPAPTVGGRARAGAGRQCPRRLAPGRVTQRLGLDEGVVEAEHPGRALRAIDAGPRCRVRLGIVPGRDGRGLGVRGLQVADLLGVGESARGTVGGVVGHGHARGPRRRPGREPRPARRRATCGGPRVRSRRRGPDGRPSR